MAQHDRLNVTVTRLMQPFPSERRMFVGPTIAKRWIVERITVNSDVSPQLCVVYKNIVSNQAILHEIANASHNTVETSISINAGERLVAVWNQPGNCTLLLEGQEIVRNYNGR